MRALERAADHCTCVESGPLCAWHKANRERIRGLYQRMARPADAERAPKEQPEEAA